MIIATAVMMSVVVDIYPTLVNNTPPEVHNVDAGDNADLHEVSKPIIVAKSAILNQGDVFTIGNYVKAYSTSGTDLTSYITIVGQGVDTSTIGKYTVTFKCTYQNVSSYTVATYIVE